MGLPLGANSFEHFSYSLFKWQLTIFVQSVEEILSKVPTTPSVHNFTFLSCHCSEMEFIVSISTIKEEARRESFWVVHRSIDKDLLGTSLYCSQVDELRVVAFNHKLAISARYHVLS